LVKFDERAEVAFHRSIDLLEICTRLHPQDSSSDHGPLLHPVQDAEDTL
jgi:hypothetical protein